MAQRNAKEELQTVLGRPGMAKVLAARVTFNEDYQYEPDSVPASEIATLVMGFTKAEEDLFWAQIDRTYDGGYGGQELFGTVWLQDGSWLIRGEYDGSEWWAHMKRPAIPRR